MLHHGTDEYSEQELRERYAYLLPIYVTRAMEILTDYEPELIIEIDVTEARRVMMGLAPLSQGKLFFMNNGASGYNDYSSFRTMSMRTIPNEYNGIIPLELFTYANYPHDTENFLDYNVNTSLISGHGFWGNLKLMKEAERLKVGKKVAASKRVLPYLTNMNTEIQGKVGDALEVYSQINEEESAGQIFVFNTESYNLKKKIRINTGKLLGVMNQTYDLNSDTITINFKDANKISTQAAFVIPNMGSGTSIISSTTILDDLSFDDGELQYLSKGSGQQNVIWNNKYGLPDISASEKIQSTFEDRGDYTLVKITTYSLTTVKISSK